MKNPIAYALLLVLLSGVLAGCVSDQGALPECQKTRDLYLDTVSPEGYSSQIVSDLPDDVLLRPGQEATFRLHKGECPASTYRWTIIDIEPYEYGFGGSRSESFVTHNETATVGFDHVGLYTFKVDLLDGAGNELDHSGMLSMRIYVNYVVEDRLPTDGSTWSTTFPSICCPIYSITDITVEEPGVLGRDWLPRYVLERTGEVLWEAPPYRPDDWAASLKFHKELGFQWQENIRFELVPQGVDRPTEVEYQYHIEYRIGTWGDLGDA